MGGGYLGGKPWETFLTKDIFPGKYIEKKVGCWKYEN